MSLRLIAWGVVLVLAVLPVSAEPFNFENAPGKLPKNTRPLAYRVDIVPDLEKLATAAYGEEIDFKAKEEVDVEVLKPTDTITLNANDLVFENVAIDGVKALEICLFEKEQTAKFRFPSQLPTGIHKLTLTYAGKISNKPEGLFYSDYIDDPSAPKRRMLVTQFEATDARRMFPSWDEPAFKATVALSIVVPRGFRVVSNLQMTREEELPGGSKKKVIFPPTPKMSSYLAVLVGSESGHVRQTIANIDVGVITTPPRRAPQGRYALDQMTHILPYYDDYFGVPYPLPKLDLIAIPDFAATAMENWGGITYIDYSLLFDDKSSIQSTKETIFEVVAHEVAHQWFGNLVTMGWWDDLWLNEGFATWMQKNASNDLNKSWQIWRRAAAEKEGVMALDAVRTTHPIEHKIVDESEIDGAFDDITYQKGGAVIRMIEDYAEKNNFKSGIRDYIKAHAYSNASTTDLWAALDKASGKPIAKIASGFTAQPGIPLVKVEEHCAGDRMSVTLTQGRFAIPPISDTSVWQVPVRIGAAGADQPQLHVLTKDPLALSFAGCDKPIKANVGNVGYYRVQYDDATHKRLTASFPALAPDDRVNLVADSWALAKAETAGTARFLDLAEQLSSEEDLAVWTRVIDTLREIDELERDNSGRQAFRGHAIGLLRPVLDRLNKKIGTNEDTSAPPDLLLRALVIKTLGRFGDTLIIDQIRKWFEADPATQPKELREPTAIVVGYVADENIFNKLRQIGNAAPDTETKLRYYYALAGAHRSDLIAQVVEIALTDELPSGRIDRYLILAARASDNPDEVWQRVYQRRQDIFKKLTGGHRNRLLPGIGAASLNPAVLAELKKMAADPEASKGARYEADKAVAQIEARMSFRQGVLKEVAAWLDAHPRR